MCCCVGGVSMRPSCRGDDFSQSRRLLPPSLSSMQPHAHCRHDQHNAPNLHSPRRTFSWTAPTAAQRWRPPELTPQLAPFNLLLARELGSRCDVIPQTLQTTSRTVLISSLWSAACRPEPPNNKTLQAVVHPRRRGQPEWPRSTRHHPHHAAGAAAAGRDPPVRLPAAVVPGGGGGGPGPLQVPCREPAGEGPGGMEGCTGGLELL
jgi:hypothetical protein